MLRKLLKYDMRSIWRIFWIVAVSLLSLTTVSAFGMRDLISMKEPASGLDALRASGSGMLVLAGIMGIVASWILIWIFVYIQFYKNFFTDEGYLTFTLPVRRKTLLLSKTVNALIWMGAQTVLTVICICIYMLIAPPAEKGGPFLNTVVFEVLGELFENIWEALGVWLIVYIVELFLLFFFLQLFSISLIHFCITIGAVIAKKLKILVAIGIYYAIQTVISSLTSFSVFTIGTGLSGFNVIYLAVDLMSRMSDDESYAGAMLILLVACLMVAAMACTVYCMTLDKLERKLNLT